MDPAFYKNRLFGEVLFFSVLTGLYAWLRIAGFQQSLAQLVAAVQNPPLQGYIHEQLAGFDTGLNVYFPIIGGATLLTLSWLTFHSQIHPQIKARRWDWRLGLLILLSLLLLAGALEVYHEFRQYLRLEHDPKGQITGLRVYSLYRARTLLLDGLGILILFNLLELAISGCNRFRERLQDEDGLFYQIVAYIPLAGLATGLSWLALTWQWPTPLWAGDTRIMLYWGGLTLVAWLLQEFILQEFLPELKRTGGQALPTVLPAFLAIWLIGVFLVWGCSVAFNFRHTQAYFSGLAFTLISAVIIAALRGTLFYRQSALEQQVASTAAELAQLQQQLNPHFLFNALNSLYTAAMRENSHKTAEGIQRLGDMMRFILSENNRHRIPLEKELAYLDNYLQLQRIRVDESQGITIEVQIQEPDGPAYIAPMMLIPFVENAFKHGISHRSPSWITISLTISNGQLVFSVSNSLPAKPGLDPEAGRHGVGLDNLRKRLNLIYPNRYTLDIRQTPGEYRSVLTLQLW